MRLGHKHTLNTQATFLGHLIVVQRSNFDGDLQLESLYSLTIGKKGITTLIESISELTFNTRKFILNKH